MLKILKDTSFEGTNIPLGGLLVDYPENEKWDMQGFTRLKEYELVSIMSRAGSFNRKEVFGENPYYRYFKKYKKSYMVMLQAESFLLKGRPFPDVNLINQIAFLTELKTYTLIGSHDVDKIEGTLTIFRGTEKVAFTGMGGRDAHIYPGDISGKDDQDIIFSMIGGVDNRTYISPETRRAAYFVFGVDNMNIKVVTEALDMLEKYVLTLAPDAITERIIL
ncbi:MULTISPECIES: hypothetical protein [Priestia]|uniref:hypothetical protein n=1 Tax=Priestia TaxID=2800373 RepID=UPI002FFEC0C3